MQKRAAEAKAKKAAMIATIESRTIEINETPRKLNDSTLCKAILKSEDYKNKVNDKENIVFLIIDDPSNCPIISDKIIQQKNVWFVIIDKDVELSGLVSGSRQIVIKDGKRVKD